MADSIKFSISATPLEVTDVQQGTGPTVAATECFGTVGGSGEVASIAIVDAGGSDDGYIGGTGPYYAQAIKVAAASVTPAAHGFVNLAACKFLYIKHTGYEGDTGGAKSTTANTVDYVSVMVNAGAGTDICIARLKSGEAMILPARGGLATNNIMLAATDVAGAAGASVNGVAVEFLAFA